MRRLTDEQQAVVDHDDGHAIVSAVAGSGKTATLIARIERLLHDGAAPSRLLVLQFNREARDSFEKRLAEVCADGGLPQVETYHSFALKAVNRLQSRGYLPRANLDSREPARVALARWALREAWERDNRRVRPTQAQLDEFMAFIARAKATFDPPERVFEAMRLPDELHPFVAALDIFDDRRQRDGIRHFDDLIRDAVLAVWDAPEAAALLNGYDELAVDECQDVNPVCYELVKIIASGGARLIAVGDIDQSIYEWRGSSPEFLGKTIPLEFGARLYRLRYTFRYGHRLACAANNLILRNADRDDKITLAHPSTPDTRVTRVPLPAGGGASGLVERLRAHTAAGGRLMDAAMLVRNFGHALPFEAELIEAGIPYRIYGSGGLPASPAALGLVLAVALSSDLWPVPPDRRHELFNAALMLPTMYLTARDAGRIGQALMRAHAAQEPRWTAALDNAAKESGRNAGQVARLAERSAALRAVAAMRDVPPVRVMDVWANRAGLGVAGGLSREQADELRATVSAMRALAQRAGTAQALMRTVEAMLSGKQARSGEDHLRVTSIHRFKGAEADIVFLGGWAAGSFPAEGAEGREEERRLAYVALTRARREVVIFHPEDGVLAAAGRTGVVIAHEGALAASQYLHEADPAEADALGEAVAAGQPVTLRLRTAAVARRYLAEAGVTHVSVRDAEKPVLERVGGAVRGFVRAAIAGPATLASANQACPGMRINHPTVGDATVLALCGGALRVRADDGATRYLSVIPGQIRVLGNT